MKGHNAPLRFNRTEFSGSLGDLGLFIPLVVAMAAAGQLDIGIILIAAGAMNVATGFFFRQPIPVQPMKAIAAVVITEGLTRGGIMAAGLWMGAILLVLSLTGTVDKLNRYVPKALVRGIQLGVGVKLALKGVDWITALPFNGWTGSGMAVLATGVLALMLWKKVSGLVYVFAAGFMLLYLSDPPAYAGIGFTLPAVSFTFPTGPEWWTGLYKGALVQLPLTLLNSVIAVCALSGDYFPGRMIPPRKMAASVGLMNLVCVPFGAIPMCHGAGGLAAQHAFGARTGGSVIMLGTLKVIIGLAFGGMLMGLLSAYPMAVLGPMLVFAGLKLAGTAKDLRGATSLFTAGATMAGILVVNAGVGFVAGTAAFAVCRLIQHIRRKSTEQ